MNTGLVKTEVLCPTLWSDKPFKISLPPMFVEDHIHLAFTIPWYGEIDGMFEVTELLHTYNGQTGYTQRIKIKPVE